MKTLFDIYQEAEKAFNASESDMGLLAACEIAEQNYFDAEKVARRKWREVKESLAKISAEQNADDTLIENGINPDNRLAWYEFALASLEV